MILVKFHKGLCKMTRENPEPVFPAFKLFFKTFSCRLQQVYLRLLQQIN